MKPMWVVWHISTNMVSFHEEDMTWFAQMLSELVVRRLSEWTVYDERELAAMSGPELVNWVTEGRTRYMVVHDVSDWTEDDRAWFLLMDNASRFAVLRGLRSLAGA